MTAPNISRLNTRSIWTSVYSGILHIPRHWEGTVNSLCPAGLKGWNDWSMKRQINCFRGFQWLNAIVIKSWLKFWLAVAVLSIAMGVPSNVPRPCMAAGLGSDPLSLPLVPPPSATSVVSSATSLTLNLGKSLSLSMSLACGANSFSKKLRAVSLNWTEWKEKQRCINCVTCVSSSSVQYNNTDKS